MNANQLLRDATLSSNTEDARSALAAGADPNEYDAHGMTPLLYAVFRGDEATVCALLEGGADANRHQRDDRMCTPLWHAKEDFGLFTIAEILRSHGGT